MKHTALIAEDEALLAENLRQELARLWPELHIVSMAAHGQAAVDAALQKHPDVCFLDIRMPGMTGLEAAAAMAEDWPADQPFPLLVFVTAYDQYAVQAFERSAIDYVLKPVQSERLAQTCERLKKALALRQSAGHTNPPAPQVAEPASLELAIQQLRQLLGTAIGEPGSNAANTASGANALTARPAPPLRLLQVGLGNTIHMVPVDEVLYFEAADKYVRVLTASKEHLVRISLRELLPQLDTQRFWQVHRSVIVRSDAIDRVIRDETGKVTLHLHGSPERIAVSRLYAPLFKGL
ncbi:LytR/AlgR family response regulator transcription factor [Paucibacter sp. Y2R2-4]|uniref:LytR/AlgR family response regulator transcription factor n=1 Tax=Paucibacter sp. Y2R2-4 TaxID=2893553 RepID=UPI0021E4A176|nr:LytTR family DNA-binding domain-containing protein [Paucibacter sp. Y2R2-4]MCV2351908.1 LytTR family DNA-binding domain-containing protein [Paucibacter sp. Y2R2-4]